MDAGIRRTYQIAAGVQRIHHPDCNEIEAHEGSGGRASQQAKAWTEAEK
jgi:hypothetical protein